MTKAALALFALLSAAASLPSGVEAQTCYGIAQAIMSIPATAVPLGGGVFDKFSGEGGARIGFECGDRLSLGADVELDHTELRRMAYLLLSFGPRFPLDASENSPWVQMTAQVGAFFGSQTGATTLQDINSGEQINFWDDGPTLGGRLRLGIPLNFQWSLLVDASVRVLFVATRQFPERTQGNVAETRLPLAVGFRVNL